MFINLVTVGAFLVICLLVFLIGDWLSMRRRAAWRTAGGPDTPAHGAAVSPLQQALAGVIPQSAHALESVQNDLRRAGYYRPTALVEYLATRNTLTVGLLIITGVLAVLADPGTRLPQTILMAGMVLSALGYGLPRYVLRWQARRRVARIQQGLPDALDVVTMCITGGLSLQLALQRVAQELRLSHPDIAVEFDIIRRQADADTMTHALRQFARRINAPDVNALSALVSQTERMGTHIATAVCEYADSVRRAHRQRAEERANKTSIKLLFPVILCLAPPIYILLCGPPMVNLYRFVKDAHSEGGILNPGTLNSMDPATPPAAMDDLRRRRDERRQRQRTDSDWRAGTVPTTGTRNGLPAVTP